MAVATELDGRLIDPERCQVWNCPGQDPVERLVFKIYDDGSCWAIEDMGFIKLWSHYKILSQKGVRK